jgi:hypothetical protein
MALPLWAISGWVVMNVPRAAHHVSTDDQRMRFQPLDYLSTPKSKRSWAKVAPEP